MPYLLLKVFELMVCLCHSEGAAHSKSKSKKILVKEDVPKAKATEESPVQAGWKNQV
jgi:hypothetical protein